VALSPVFTDSTEPVTAADITHRRHAIIETVFADLIDGPLATCPRDASAPTPPGSCAAIAHNLLHAAGCSPAPHRQARDPTPQDVTVPARLAATTPTVLHCPPTGPGQTLAALWRTIGRPRPCRHPDHPAKPGQIKQKGWADQQKPHAHKPAIKILAYQPHDLIVGRVGGGLSLNTVQLSS
jgi:hypothetical protein